MIENTLAKGVDSVSPFVKGVEILPDGSVARTGTNYSGKFQEAHDASKASIQSRISNLESGGVKDTGNRDVDIPPAFKQEEFASTYESRFKQTPAETNSNVVFEGVRGESLCTLKPPPDPMLQKILNEAGINGIEYKNGVPDFSPVAKAQLEIDYMLGGKGAKGNTARDYNFKQANERLADQLNNSPELANQFGMEAGGITAKDIEKYLVKNKLTWHELNDGVTIQLVPTEINAKFGHLGGVGEINAGAFEPGGFANK
ncbi:HNH endonuclease [Bacillus cereus]|uniref:HNH endonuclease n=1 Tax=Bacillus sp. OE TaxID=2293320 RepID=UPI000E2E883E|nr:HNH endonuclease [Bacillus sp. OE]